VVLHYSDKTVNPCVARVLRVIGDVLEGEGYHIIMMPLPDEARFNALVLSGGKNLKKINDVRLSAGLWDVTVATNDKVLNKTWTGLYKGTGVWFKIAHRLSLHIPEFVGLDLINKISSALTDGYGCEVLSNEKYSVVYLYESPQLS